MITPKLSIVDLPNEILILIFGQLRPKYWLESSSDSFPDYRNQNYCIPWLPGLYESSDYWLETRAYARLRFICRRANTIIKPLLYEHFIIRLPSVRFEIIETIFYYHSRHIRAISVDADRVPSELWNQASDILGRGIGLCTNLRSLQCRGHHCLFPNRAWFPRIVKGMFPNMRSLSFNPQHMDASLAIQAFGHQLQTLELYGWFRKRRPYPLHLPKELPVLEEFTICYGDPPLSDVQKILTRIGSRDPTEGSRTHPLRSLNIIEYTQTYSLSDLLSVNDIGKHLTKLRITRYRPLLDVTPVSQTLIPILSTCPQLHTLYIELCSWQSDLEWVPNNLRHLTIFSRSRYWTRPPKLRPELGPLRTLTYLRHNETSVSDTDLLRLLGPSEDAGVKVEPAHDDRWQGATGYKFIFPEKTSPSITSLIPI